MSRKKSCTFLILRRLYATALLKERVNAPINTSIKHGACFPFTSEAKFWPQTTRRGTIPAEKRPAVPEHLAIASRPPAVLSTSLRTRNLVSIEIDEAFDWRDIKGSHLLIELIDEHVYDHVTETGSTEHVPVKAHSHRKINTQPSRRPLYVSLARTPTSTFHRSRC